MAHTISYAFLVFARTSSLHSSTDHGRSMIGLFQTSSKFMLQGQTKVREYSTLRRIHHSLFVNAVYYCPIKVCLRQFIPVVGLNHRYVSYSFGVVENDLLSRTYSVHIFQLLHCSRGLLLCLCADTHCEQWTLDVAM